MRRSFVLWVGAMAAAVACGVACYQTTAPPPWATTTTTGAELDASVSGGFADPWEKDAGAAPGVGIRGGPMGQPTPWRGSSGGGSR